MKIIHFVTGSKRILQVTEDPNSVDNDNLIMTAQYNLLPKFNSIEINGSAVSTCEASPEVAGKIRLK